MIVFMDDLVCFCSKFSVVSIYKYYSHWEKIFICNKITYI